MTEGSTCPYCRTAFATEDEIISCSSCATEHHTDCYEENGGCTVFGCANAPADEPKVSVSGGDLAGDNQPGSSPPSVPPPPPVVVMPTPPPPRPAGAVPPPPPVRPEVITYPTFAGYAPAPQAPPSGHAARKSRVVFVLLAVLLGAFGGHNFYAGYVKKAVIQLCITIFSCFLGSVVSWVWAIVEACIVDRDDDGIAFV